MTLPGVRLAVVAVLGYLIGGIPWALIVGRVFYGVDVRKEGSGNLGATNVYRVLGRKAGLATFALDVLKGMAAVEMATLVVPESQYGSTMTAWAEIAAALAVILGHSYSPYIGFKGGRGVATAAGALLVLTPWVVPIEVAVWALLVWVTGMVSLGSVVIALLFPVLAAVFYGGSTPIVVFAVVGAAVVIWRHRTNIRRIARGEEPRVSWSRPMRRARHAGGSQGVGEPRQGSGPGEDGGRR